ncbi:hypothetical protein BC832DRAFT_300677 [Gaertneriomyces semiglobifer]|nr:hypothetical protein BC832DRAFT_300677 [Gaertneriomyces semiglobifer]
MDLLDIAISVFHFLDKVSLVRCERVCKAWKRILDDNAQGLWQAHVAEVSPVQGQLPVKLPSQTWKDVLKVRRGWDHIFNDLAQKSSIASVDPIVANVLVEDMPDMEDRPNEDFVIMSSYGSSRSRLVVQSEAIGPYFLYATPQGEKQRKMYVGNLDVRQATSTQAKRLLPPTTPGPPRLQPAGHASAIPVHEGDGWMSFWDPKTGECKCRFRAIDDRWCQGRLYGNLYACFNPSWVDDVSEFADARRSVRVWNLEDPEVPRIQWEVETPSHIVDVAHNDAVIACAYGSSFVDDEPDPDSPFGLEIRSVKTGEFIRNVPALNGASDVMFLAITNFHIIISRAPVTQILAVVSIKAGELLYEINLMTSFAREWCGMNISGDGRTVILWSTKNMLAVVDLVNEDWNLYHREVEVDDEAEEQWDFGVWAVVRTGGEPTRASRRNHLVVWRAIGGLEVPDTGYAGI